MREYLNNEDGGEKGRLVPWEDDKYEVQIDILRTIGWIIGTMKYLRVSRAPRGSIEHLNQGKKVVFFFF